MRVLAVVSAQVLLLRKQRVTLFFLEPCGVSLPGSGCKMQHKKRTCTNAA